MTELNVLRVLLLVSLALAPLGTHRVLLPRAKAAALAHALAFLGAALGLFASMPLLCVGWLAFCAASFARFLWHQRASLRSPFVLAAAVPFAFSNIAAVWLVGGANDLHLLGYGETFSYYAALHGNVLGWMMVGSIAMLASQDRPDQTRPHRKLYAAAVLVCFVSFLLVAVGIDGLHGAKRVGVVGLSVAIPFAQLVFVKSVWRTHKGAFVLACTSFAGLMFTFVLAWQNELGAVSFPAIANVRPMVSLHGVINGVVVAPCFLFAVVLERRGPRGNSVDSVYSAP